MPTLGRNLLDEQASLDWSGYQVIIEHDGLLVDGPLAESLDLIEEVTVEKRHWLDRPLSICIHVVRTKTNGQDNL